MSATKKQKTNAYSPKNVLITGGCGFIGSHVVKRIVQQYPQYNVVVLDALFYCASVHNLDSVKDAPNFKLIKGDITSADLVRYVFESEKIDSVLHLAASSHVDNSFGNSLTFTHNNVVGTHVLLECAKQFKIGRFVHVSTDEVYGEVLSDRGAREDHTILAPTNPYAATKAAAEMIVSAYRLSFGLPVIITRGNNVYGPHQFPEKLIPKFALLLNGDKPVPLHGDGSNRRSFLHVDDVARAMDTVLHCGVDGETYNIGTRFEVTNVEVARALCRHFNKDPEKYLQFTEDRPFNDARYAIDSSKLEALGWKPEVGWEEGLKATIDWYINLSPGHWDTPLDMALTAHPRI